MRRVNTNGYLVGDDKGRRDLVRSGLLWKKGQCLTIFFPRIEHSHLGLEKLREVKVSFVCLERQREVIEVKSFRLIFNDYYRPSWPLVMYNSTNFKCNQYYVNFTTTPITIVKLSIEIEVGNTNQQ